MRLDTGKTRKLVSEIKWVTPPASPTSKHPGQDPKNSASEPCEEINLPVRNTFKDPVSKKKYFFFEIAYKLAGREAASIFNPQKVLDHAGQSVWIGDNQAW